VADQAKENTGKLAFGEISDIETYSLLFITNMANGLHYYPDMSHEEIVRKAEIFGFTREMIEADNLLKQGDNSPSDSSWQWGFDTYESYVGNTKQPHQYSYNGYGCRATTLSSCGSPFEQFTALRRYAGPGTDGKNLADNGTISYLNIGLSSFVPFNFKPLKAVDFSFGYVAHLIEPSTSSLINITLPNAHPLHPGFVVRNINPDGNGGFKVNTMGWGTGSSPVNNSNEWMAEPLWGINSDHIGYYAKQFDFHRLLQRTKSTSLPPYQKCSWGVDRNGQPLQVCQ